MIKRLGVLALCLGIVMMCFPVTEAHAEDITYTHKETFSNDYSSDGIYSQCIEGFHIGEWNVINGSLTLYYSVSQLLSGIASMDISMNGASIGHSDITASNGERQALVVDLPVNLIVKDTVNTLTVSASLPYQSETCSDYDSFSRWLNIFKDSFVSVGYTTASSCKTIGDFYKDLSSVDATENYQSAICLPQGADETEYNCAAYALAGISNQSVLNYDRIGFRSISELSGLSGLKYAVLISDIKHLPEDVDALLSDSSKNSAKISAVMELVKSGSTNLLIITGSDNSVIEKAGYLLENPDMMESIDTTQKTLDNNTDYSSKKWEVPQYFALSDDSITLRGVFEQKASVYIDYPANRTISKSSQLSLDYSYSDKLDFNRSLLTVYINNTPIGSRALSSEKASGDSAVFDIPQDLKVTGSFNVQVVFNLDAGADWCKLTSDEMPWARIENTSMFKLSSTDMPPLKFDNYPSPFIRDGRFDNLVVLIPDNPQNEDIESLRLVMITLGQFIKDNTGSLNVRFASNRGDLSHNNVISIGKAKVNPILEENSNKVCFSYGPDGMAFKSKVMPFETEYAQNVGTIQMLESSYSKTEHALLIISAQNAAGLVKGASLLGSVTKLWGLSGDSAVTDGESIYCFDYNKNDNIVSPAPSSQAPAEKNNGLMVYLPFGGALVLLIMGLIMIKVKYAGKGKS